MRFWIDFIWILILILVIVKSVQLVIEMIEKAKRKKFSRQYEIGKLPESIKIKRGIKKEYNYFKLKYPYWEASKKDGTADLRVKGNDIIWPESFLYVDKLMLKSTFPYDLLYVVKELRAKGVRINLCKEEKIKYAKLKNEREMLVNVTSIQNLVNKYEENPTDFEKLCAELFKEMGYQTKVTSQSNDGGYDIILLKNNEATIVECKCYSLANKVGRPAIQKLVGANKIALANRMIFITTSEFSSYAISYAQKVGVELIDGNKLMQYLKEYLNFDGLEFEENEDECQLEITDMRPYVPNDIYEEYFLSNLCKSD